MDRLDDSSRLPIGPRSSGKSTLIRNVQLGLSAFSDDFQQHLASQLQWIFVEAIREAVDVLEASLMMQPGLVDGEMVQRIQEELQIDGEPIDEDQRVPSGL